MLVSALLTTTFIAAGSVQAAVAQGSWGVRADFTRCDSTRPLEVVLGGAGTNHSSPAANITDFSIKAPFDGSLVIKVAGSAGLGSPYPPQQVRVQVFSGAAGGDQGVWGNATVKPGTGQPASVARLVWSTREDTTLEPAEGEEASLETTVDGGSLVVYYCGVPEAGGPVV